MMINKLILEDNDRRINQFLYYHPDAVVCKTAEEAISKLQLEEEWHIVWLDHDLGGETFVDSGREDCGMEVVRWIEREQPTIHNIIVHSWNPDAARAMQRALKKAGYHVVYIPFGVRGYAGVEESDAVD